PARSLLTEGEHRAVTERRRKILERKDATDTRRQPRRLGIYPGEGSMCIWAADKGRRKASMRLEVVQVAAAPGNQRPVLLSRQGASECSRPGINHDPSPGKQSGCADIAA